MRNSEKEIMGMLDRYKKKGGFVQLLTLIETSGKQKQEQFLGLIAQENAVWEAALKKKLLTTEAIFHWPAEHRSEVFSRVQPLTLATALHGMPKEKMDEVLNCISQSEKRKLEQVMSEINPTPAEKGTCLMKIINETRGFIAGGILKIEKIDPDLVIPENIEEQLSHQTVEMAVGPLANGSLEQVSVEVPKFEPKTAGADHSKEELLFLRSKVNQLASDNASLKHEVIVLRGKLDQIRKIA